MATKTKAAKAKASKNAAPEPEVEDETSEEVETKTRGRRADAEKNAELVEVMLPLVEVVGELPNVRFKNIGEAAKEAGIDSIRAAKLLRDHLAADTEMPEATAEAIVEARDVQHVAWGVIASMFGITKTQVHNLYDSVHGEGAHSSHRLYGADGVKPKAEKTKSEGGGKRAEKQRDAAANSTPLFDDPDGVESAEIKKRIDGKTIKNCVHSNGEPVGLQKVKVASGLKVSKPGPDRKIKFTDEDGKARTLLVDHLRK